MFTIVKKEKLSPVSFSFWLKAPEIAHAYRPGQFVILRVDEAGERIPLTIVDTDLKKGLIRIIFSVVGKTSYKLSLLEESESIRDVVGPLGNPTHISCYGNTVVVGGGVGIAPLYPITRALMEAGNTITTILGARSKDFLLLEDEMKKISRNMIITTDDGSAGIKGFVTTALEEIIKNNQNPVDFVMAVGPVVMMKAVSDLTKRYEIKTMVSLNTMMIDGTGMCGGCRCTVDKKTMFACVHGPEFDAHKIDFDEIIWRQRAFHKHEKESFEHIKKN